MVPDGYSVLMAFRDTIANCGVSFVTRDTIFLPNEKKTRPDFYVELAVIPGTTLPRTEFDYATPMIVNCIVVTTRTDGSEQAYDVVREISNMFTANQVRRKEAKAKLRDRDGNFIIIRRAEQLAHQQDENTFRINLRITTDVLSKG